MLPCIPQRFPSEGAANRLRSVFAEIETAVEQRRLRDALRLADRACRLAPADRTCSLVNARVLLKAGAASEAIECLRGRDEPEAIVTRGEALHMLGKLDDAAASAEYLLRRFAADTVENLRQLADRLCRPPARLPGWIGVDSRSRLIGEIQSGLPAAVAYDGKIRHPAVLSVNSNGLASFEFELPAAVSGRIAAFSGHVPLLGSGFAWPPDFGLFGWVMLSNQTLVGELRLDWAPNLPLTLAIRTAGGGPARLFVLPAAAGSRAPAFSVPLDGLARDVSHIDVCAVLPDGTHWPLCGSPIQIPGIAPIAISARPERTARAAQDHRLRSHRMVDIVIPVYTGLKETLFCLERLLETTTRSEAEVVVVNDASPDPDLCAALDRLTRDGRITLLTNPSNLGFPGSANRGIRLHPERDVVLINSDAEVPAGWIDRLRCAAYHSEDIGTVTPLGEAASIMSYPAETDGAQARLNTAKIDRIACEVNADLRIDLPVGVGFCLYIKRACLEETGAFDEVSFGKGYGEENDFCLRARRNGWRHVGAPNLFVGHLGGKSYGRLKEMLMERNRRVLNALHPGYDALIADFVAADPMLHARREIDARRLVAEAKNSFLLVTFDLTGGVKRHVDQRRSQLIAAGHTALILQPAGTPGQMNRVILRPGHATLENLVYELPQESHILARLLSMLALSHIEIHHFAGLPAAALELVTHLGVPYDVYVHDYSWICPRLTLIGGDNAYCGEPPVEDCETCIRAHGTELDESLTVAALRTRSAGILNGAKQVIVPTNDVRSRLAGYFPDVSMQVIPWEAPIRPRPCSSVRRSGRVCVAVIGAIGIQKGHQILLECARDAAQRNLNLDFVVIGYTIDDAPLLATGRVFITGSYADGEIASLLEREQCQIALFLSVAPETWCYALTHAMAAGLPIAAFRLGAIAERLSAYGAAHLLPLAANAAQINDSLLSFLQRIIFSDIQKPEIQKELPMSETLLNEELEATTKILNLPVGVYAFTVQGAPPAISSNQLAIPAVQLGLAPMKSPGTVEFLPGAGTLDRWLTRSTDTFIVKISVDSVALLLTSVRLPSSSVLTINVQRIDAQPQTEPPDVQDTHAQGEGGVLPVQMLAHIENFGDIYFKDGRAGFSGQKLRLEAFAILSAGAVQPDAIEYCGVMADGYQTPWLSNQVLCGSRGRGMPLTGFAIRLKPEISAHYDCSYIGRFVSGTQVGPVRDGELCSSGVPGDALEAIEIQIAEHSSSESQPSYQAIAS